MRHYLSVLVAVVILVIPWLAYTYPYETGVAVNTIEEARDQIASIFVAHNPKSVEELQSKYNSVTPQNAPVAKKIRILLVPGHEPDQGGAEFESLKERVMTVELANDLKSFLSQNSRYEVFVTRDTQVWNPTFANYFKNNQVAIQSWLQSHKDEITDMTRLGLFKPVSSAVFHNDAPSDVALRLYGIDKWVNENDIDIAIHIHFNDYPTHPRGEVGKYSGFTIYVPQNEYYNSSTTQALADTVFRRLAKYNAVSNLPGESGGVVQDPDLIAIGAFNSVDAASMLIEYGYIYEQQFTNDSLRSAAIKDLAFQTYLGLQDFFDPHNAVSMSGAADTLVMPHQWTDLLTDASKSATSSADIFALQTALLLDGDYPPENMSLNDCPRTGKIGPCTKAALDQFQSKHGIRGEQGVVGEQTIEALNKMYGSAKL